MRSFRGASDAPYALRTTDKGVPHMARLGFGAFLAPHHPIGENPTLQFRRDLKFVEHLDELGYDEFWCGEHHSSGWEMLASPEMFLAAAGERTKRIKLGTGVISLPYHHPYNVAQRMVQLDHMTGGRAIFGSGSGGAAARSSARARAPCRRTPIRSASIPWSSATARTTRSTSSAACSRASASPRRPTGTPCRMPPCSSCPCRRTCPLPSPRRSARRA